MKVVNLTPHDVVVETESMTITYKASGCIARVNTEERVVELIHDAPITTVTYHGVTFTKEVPPADLYIVSSLTLEASRGTEWQERFIAPNTSNANRDVNNFIKSVNGFKKIVDNS